MHCLGRLPAVAISRPQHAAEPRLFGFKAWYSDVATHIMHGLRLVLKGGVLL